MMDFLRSLFSPVDSEDKIKALEKRVKEREAKAKKAEQEQKLRDRLTEANTRIAKARPQRLALRGNMKPLVIAVGFIVLLIVIAKACGG